MRQFDQPPAVGTEVELLVVRFDAEEGLYELTRPTAAVDVGNWDEVREGQIIEVNVTGSNKGGLECQVSGIRGFIPMGQVSIYRVETPEELVGQRLACVVTEASRERRNLVLSHRAVMERERNEQRDKMMAELAPGQLREGIVRSIKDFGAFVDLGGVDGLVHVSQLSWDRVNHPSEVLEVGQKIKVRIEKFDKDTGKVSLSYREVGANPWQKVASKYQVGARATGSVSRLMDFGAFVKLEPGVEGLIHVSELAHGRVFRVSDVLSEKQEVEVKVLSVDAEKQRISLSLKALMSAPTKPGQQKVADEDLPPPPDAPKPPKKKATHLKGGTGGPSGGEKFGLNW
jgi:small subunit ribosomal protein S1